MANATFLQLPCTDNLVSVFCFLLTTAIDELGNAFDFNGKHSAENIEEQWLAVDEESESHPDYIEVYDESSLRYYVGDGWDKPLVGYNDQDVQIALGIALTRLATVLPAPSSRS